MNVLEALERKEVLEAAGGHGLRAGDCFAGRPSCFGVLHLNIRSVNKNFEEFVKYLEGINVEKVHVM